MAKPKWQVELGIEGKVSGPKWKHDIGFGNAGSAPFLTRSQQKSRRKKRTKGSSKKSGKSSYLQRNQEALYGKQQPRTAVQKDRLLRSLAEFKNLKDIPAPLTGGQKAADVAGNFLVESARPFAEIWEAGDTGSSGQTVEPFANLPASPPQPAGIGAAAHNLGPALNQLGSSETFQPPVTDRQRELRTPKRLLGNAALAASTVYLPSKGTAGAVALGGLGGAVTAGVGANVVNKGLRKTLEEDKLQIAMAALLAVGGRRFMGRPGAAALAPEQLALSAKRPGQLALGPGVRRTLDVPSQTALPAGTRKPFVGSPAGRFNDPFLTPPTQSPAITRTESGPLSSIFGPNRRRLDTSLDPERTLGSARESAGRATVKRSSVSPAQAKLAAARAAKKKAPAAPKPKATSAADKARAKADKLIAEAKEAKKNAAKVKTPEARAAAKEARIASETAITKAAKTKTTKASAAAIEEATTSKSFFDLLRNETGSSEVGGLSDLGKGAGKAVAGATKKLSQAQLFQKVTAVTGGDPEKITLLQKAMANPKLREKMTPDMQGAYDSIASHYKPAPIKPKRPPVKAKAPVTTKPPVKAVRPLSGIKKDSKIVKRVVNFREKVEDRAIRGKRLLEQTGVSGDAANWYQRQKVFSGRLATRLEDVDKAATTIVSDIGKTAEKLKVNTAAYKKTVNKYLVAKHTPERNLVHGERSTGMTTAEARAFSKRVEASPQGKQITKIAKQMSDLNRQTLDVLLDGEVITRKTYDTLRKQYKNHVPLQRVMDESDDIAEILSGSGFSVKSTGLKGAKGSQREVADILGNTVANVQGALQRAEKNRVNLSALKYARENPSLGLFTEIKPKILGTTSKKSGSKPIFAPVIDPLVLSLRVKGKPVHLRINDPQFASMFQGVGKNQIPEWLNSVRAVTNFYRGLHTRFNWEFALSNKVRDLQEAMVFLSSKKGVKARDVLRGNRENITAIIDFQRGKDTAGARIYRQMRSDGGTTGGISVATKKQIDVNLAKIEQVNASNPRKAAKMLINSFDNFNNVFEDSTRLASYKAGLKSGMTRDAAAALAKEATLDFNKMGTYGPVVNSLYMFSNASIQGSAKMIRSLRDPKTALKTVTAVTGAVYAVSAYNDSVDPKWRDKVTEWDRTSNLVVMMSPGKNGSARYVTIPVSWGLKPLKVLADSLVDLGSGSGQTAGSILNRFAASTFDAYNPAGGTDLLQTITPTIGDLPLDIGRNVAWHGGGVKPAWLKDLPRSEQKFKSTGDTLTGKAALGITKTAAKGGIEISPNDLIYAYEHAVGGVGKSATRVVNTASGLATGQKIPAKAIPFANRFVKNRSPEEIDRNAEREEYDGLVRDLKRVSPEQRKAIIRRQLRGKNKDKRRKILFKLREGGYDTKGISIGR